MILAQLRDISTIDEQISELHQQLQSLYEQRAGLMDTKSTATGVLGTISRSAINLDDIDLSL